jgi:cysteine desulfurase
MTSTIYLDNAATTPLAPQVFEAMRPFWTEQFGNPSSAHGAGRVARVACEHARAALARFIGADSEESVTFTSGGTEANNLAMRGVLNGARAGAHVVVSGLEHSSLLSTATALGGLARVTVLPATGDGIVDPEMVREAIRPETVLVSVMAVNNETGCVQPVAAITEIAHESGVLVHTDAVQALGKTPFDMSELGADLASFSAHKVHGPKGVGALYIRPGLSLQPQFTGGGQEGGRRAGTENVPAIVGFGRAVELLAELGEDTRRRARMLQRRMEDQLRALAGVYINGSGAPRSSFITNVSVRGVRGSTLLGHMDAAGVQVSSGSACMAHSLEPSHVLLAMGLARSRAESSIRFSFSRYTTEEDIDLAAEAFIRTVRRLRLLPAAS